MTESKIRELRTESTVDTVVRFIDDNEEFTVEFPPNWDNQCRIKTGVSEFVVSISELREIVNRICDL